MKNIFAEPSKLEKLAKEKYSVPEFIMMEHASTYMKAFILNLSSEKSLPSPNVLIICGKGNNGGDGYALGRLLAGSAKVTLVQIEPPVAEEAIAQYKMCEALNLSIVTAIPKNLSPDFIVDCLYGTGFHGDLKPELQPVFDYCNNSTAIKIACDIPSALLFNADYTITMGEQKLVLFSDKAKAVCGKILVANLGLPQSDFEKCLEPNAFLIEKSDLQLPCRTNKSAHKGTYGHTAVFAGEKAGASIIAATSAMNFGSGLTTLIKTPQSNLEQFKISPELMLSETIPQKTTCVIIGPGFNCNNSQALEHFEIWFTNGQNPTAVMDAGMFSYDGIISLLDKLSTIKAGRIVLTPHLSELSSLISKLKIIHPELNLSEQDYSVKELANNPEVKIKIGKIFNQIYPNTTLVMKSANTFIAADSQIFVCTDGCQSLAKGGSGDILAGMIGSLLAQGYDKKNAAITACEAHGLAANIIGAEAFDLTPEKLISKISEL